MNDRLSKGGAHSKAPHLAQPAHRSPPLYRSATGQSRQIHLFPILRALTEKLTLYRDVGPVQILGNMFNPSSRRHPSASRSFLLAKIDSPPPPLPHTGVWRRLIDAFREGLPRSIPPPTRLCCTDVCARARFSCLLCVHGRGACLEAFASGVAWPSRPETNARFLHDESPRGSRPCRPTRAVAARIGTLVLDMNVETQAKLVSIRTRNILAPRLVHGTPRFRPRCVLTHSCTRPFEGT